MQIRSRSFCVQLEKVKISRAEFVGRQKQFSLYYKQDRLECITI